MIKVQDDSIDLPQVIKDKIIVYECQLWLDLNDSFQQLMFNEIFCWRMRMWMLLLTPIIHCEYLLFVPICICRGGSSQLWTANSRILAIV